MLKERKSKPSLIRPIRVFSLLRDRAPFLQPYAELLLNHFRLFATVAQCHKIIRVDNDGRASWHHAAAVVVPASRGLVHALQCDIQ